MKNITYPTSAHRKSPVVQMDDYYPYGLSFNSYQRAGETEQKYLYNQGSKKTFQGLEGKEFKTERQPELQIDLTKYRAYDYTLGKWWQVDPKADSLTSFSPYNGMDNNPVRYNDPYGDCPACWGAIIGFAVEYTSQVVGNVIANGGEVTLDAFINVDGSDLLVATGAGAATGGLSALGAQFTKTAIVGGIATVNAISEGVKSTTDVKVNVITGDTKIESVYTGTKSGTKAAVEFVTGNLPLPDVTDKAAGDAINAGGQYVNGAVKSVLEEGINAQVNDKNEQQ